MEHCTQIRLTETRLIETTRDQTNIGDSIPKLASLCLDPDKNDLNISSLIVDIESFIDIFSIQIQSKYSAVNKTNIFLAFLNNFIKFDNFG